MGIQFSGIASGLPINDIIRQLIAIERRPIEALMQRKDKITAAQAQFNAVSNRITSLRSAIEKITDAKLGSSFDLFQAKMVNSSDPSKVTATVTNNATQGSFTLEVLNLATATRAQSLQTVGQVTTGASLVTDVANGSITGGNFTIFVNNEARTVTVDLANDTVQDVLDRIATEIQAVTGQAASGSVSADGKLQLSYTAGTSIQFGATGDTSNFAKITHLTTGSADAGQENFTAKYGTSVLNPNGTLLDNAARLENNSISAGTFTIGNASFTIDASTTLSGLMSEINNNSQAGVLISYNQTTNKIEMVSKNTGNQAITLDDGGTGFLESLGLVNGTDTLSSQTLGNNAKFKINGGDELESTTNTVDPATSGITGVTLNLLAATGGTPVTIDVQQNTEPLKNALSEFVKQFNNALSFIDEQTKKDAILSKEIGLKNLRGTLRTQVSDSIDFNDVYTVLAQIGISTGAVNTSPGEGAPSSKLILDEAKFLQAFADNPEEVKQLLIGDGTSAGILGKLNQTVKSSLDPEFGLFSTRNQSANRQIQNINEAIKRGEERLEVKEKQLRAKFIAMERLISQLQSQQSSLSAFAQRTQ